MAVALGDPAPFGDSVAFLSAIVEEIAHPVFVKDRAFRFVLLNRAFAEMTGLAREAALGCTDFDFFPEPQARWFRQKDEEVFRTGETVRVEEEPITDAHGTDHVLSTTKVPLRDPISGEITHLVGIIHDITRLKRAEDALRDANDELERRVAERTSQLSRAQAALIRGERLAALGQLAGGVAHQIRNPLAAISNATAVLRRFARQHTDQDCMQMVDIIAEEVSRADQIIRDLLDYGRVRPPDRELVGLDAILAGAMRQHPPPANIELVSDLRHDVGAWVDRSQVTEAVGNILQNAFDAMPDGGRIEVCVEADTDHATLVLRDSGPGIEGGEYERLFEPLVTTKAYGLGLGLAVARSLIENQGGTVSAMNDDLESGACFRLTLPRRAHDASR